MSSAAVFQAQSGFILAMIFMGLYFRRIPSVHIKFMGGAIIWDLILILQIEVSRSAITRAAHALENPAILNLHVLLALCTVILYGIMIHTGRKLLKSKWPMKSRHRTLALATITLRVLVFVTSFWAVK